MRRELLSFLDNTWVTNLDVFAQEQGHVTAGVLRHDEHWYPILDGVPCFLRGALRPPLTEFARRHHLKDMVPGQRTEAQQEQAKTNTTFSDKWRRFREYGLHSSHQAFLQQWYCRKLGVPDVASLKTFYRRKDLILEIGPGSGFNARFMAENTTGNVIAADISDAAFTTYGNTKDLPNCHVVQADVMDLPFPDGSFDFVIADGVLHHTPDTRRAVEALYRKVKPGQQFFFYLYKKMGPARQFCDAYIREHFSKLTPEECYAACEGLTDLGRELSRLNAKITLTKDIPILGIPAGTHDVQRLLYYNFVKCFWNEAFDYDTNNMVNFDWYHPHNAWQHTEDEVASWLKDLGASAFQFNAANPNGICALVTRSQTTRVGSCPMAA